MKRYTILILLPLVLSFSACEKLLDKEPTDKISIEELFQDVSGAKTALGGAYNMLRDGSHYQGNFMNYEDLLAGNIKLSPTSRPHMEEIYNITQSAANSAMNDTYQQLYNEENNVNNIIKYTPSSAGSAADKVKILAEAKCIRALIHFDLLRVFARPYGYTAGAAHPGIVLNLQPRLLGDPSGSRASVAECYQSVIADLEEAIAAFDNGDAGILASGSKQHYFTLSSAKALLAKVYLNANNWDKAYALADEVIKGGKYTLLTNANYVASWLLLTPSTESIFELPVEITFSGNSLGSYYSLQDNTYRLFATSNDLLNLYSTTDIRRSSSMFNTLATDGTTYFYTKKYPGSGTTTTPVKILRMSELYLIRAESAVEKNNPDFTVANADLNTIRKRGDASAATLNLTDKAALITAVLLERRKELAFEGNLLFDIARRGLAIERTDCTAQTCNLPANDYRMVMPFPTVTINANFNVAQNSGY